MSNDSNRTGDERDGVPEHDAPATESEKHRARVFGELVEDMLEGATPPPALEADHRELLEMATSLRAQVSDVPLEDSRRDELIDAAFLAAVGAPAADESANEPRAVDTGPAVTSLSERRGRARQLLPWVGTLVAAAAAVFLLLNRPAPTTRTVNNINIVEQPTLGDEHLSRPADALVGKIDRKDAANATSRIDMIYADRMVGYRDLRLRGLAQRAPVAKGAPQ